MYYSFPIDNIMPDYFPSIVTKKPVSFMRETKNISEVLIKETVPESFSTFFSHNDCIITIHNYKP